MVNQKIIGDHEEFQVAENIKVIMEYFKFKSFNNIAVITNQTPQAIWYQQQVLKKSAYAVRRKIAPLIRLCDTLGLSLAIFQHKGLTVDDVPKYVVKNGN